MACYGSRVRLTTSTRTEHGPEQREAASMPAHVPPVADERAGLLEFLAHQRRQVRVATFGLSDAEAAATPSASSLSLGGIVKHLAHVERNWADIIRATPRMTFEDYVEGFRFGASDSLAEVLDDYEAAAGETEKLVADI